MQINAQYSITATRYAHVQCMPSLTSTVPVRSGARYKANAFRTRSTCIWVLVHMWSKRVLIFVHMIFASGAHAFSTQSGVMQAGGGHIYKYVRVF